MKTRHHPAIPRLYSVPAVPALLVLALVCLSPARSLLAQEQVAKGVTEETTQEIAQQNTEEITAHTLRLTAGATSPAAEIESLAWMAGSWRGGGLGGEVEESWSQPSAGTMMGAFKLVQKDQPSFYEFILIVEHEGSLELRLKHFHPDFEGWEEKDDFVTFPLVRIRENEVFFRGLTYRLSGDELHIFLALHQEGTVNEIPFVLRRVVD